MGAVYWLYSMALGIALLVSGPWWLVQLLRHGKYRAGLAERLGRVPERLLRGDRGPVIWIHAVSVGEALAISRLVEELRRRLPEHRVVVSTTTQTGQKLAAERFGAENVFYFPIDFAFAVRPYLTALRPSLVVLAETEFWPNFIRLARESGAKLMVTNARISDRSLPRYRRFRGVLARVLANIDVFLAQSGQDVARLREIGAPAERVKFAGNLKFDVTPPAEAGFVDELRAALKTSAAGPTIVAGSTVAGEEPLVLEAFAKVLAQCPAAALVLAPRHRERFEEAAEAVSRAGLPTVRRSAWEPAKPLAGTVLLLDTIGELASVYGVADLAFVGGSLVQRGGHNILEPAHFGVATVVGPHTENFRDIVALFTRENAVVVTPSERLSDTLIGLLRDPATLAQYGQRARRVLETQRGATSRTVDAIAELVESGRTTPPSASQKGGAPGGVPVDGRS